MKEIKKNSLKNLKIITELKTVQNPRKISLMWGIVWLILLLILSIVICFVGNNSYLQSINNSSVIGLCISGIWFFLRIGVLEKTQLWFKNRRNYQLSKLYKVDIVDVKMDLDVYREYKKGKSWWGLIFLFVIMMLLFIPTIIVLS